MAANARGGCCSTWCCCGSCTFVSFATGILLLLIAASTLSWLWGTNRALNVDLHVGLKKYQITGALSYTRSLSDCTDPLCDSWRKHGDTTLAFLVLTFLAAIPTLVLAIFWALPPHQTCVPCLPGGSQRATVLATVCLWVTTCLAAIAVLSYTGVDKGTIGLGASWILAFAGVCLLATAAIIVSTYLCCCTRPDLADPAPAASPAASGKV